VDKTQVGQRTIVTTARCVLIPARETLMKKKNKQKKTAKK
jgi:hypothetical protein